MNSDDTVRGNRPDEEPDPTATASTQKRYKEPQPIPEPEAVREEPVAEPMGWSGRCARSCSDMLRARHARILNANSSAKIAQRRF
jgi:hypothetical protein